MQFENIDLSVILCAYTEKRWDDLVAAVASIQGQRVSPREIIVVIDHNPGLFQRARERLDGVVVIENRESRGLSGARNTGITVASGEVIAFMDEDAVASQDWLERLQMGYHKQHVLGVGGAIDPMWLEGKPGWFPGEFNWVVGCTYQGMPTEAAPVRNLIGCNMSFRREIFEENGGFRHGIGRIGTRPLGCEETELCIRAGQANPEGWFLYEPQARVNHRVPPARTNFRYFMSRCYSEGLSKAQISQLVGANDGLASERRHALRTLPQGILHAFKDTVRRGDPAGLLRAGAIVTGLAFTTLGYLVGNLALRTGRTSDYSKGGDIFEEGQMSPPYVGFGFEPIRLLEVEISQPIPDIAAVKTEGGDKYRRARAFVRLHSQPLGMLELSLGDNGLTSGDFASQIWETLADEINHHLQQDGLTEVVHLASSGLTHSGTPGCEGAYTGLLEEAPQVSVVVATHDRTESLKITLDSLLALDYPNYEIILVDNAPTTNATFKYWQEAHGDSPQVRYVREDRPGLAVAHNRGLLEVSAPIVVFTDDDVLVDKRWLIELMRGFASERNVACVTGMILPVEIETQSQAWIEGYWGLGKGFILQTYDMSGNRPESTLYPYTAGMFGSGANMAFKTSVLREIGGFDPALGAGSAALGGDDLGAFFKIITSGYQLVYQPAAIVHHRHRRGYARLRRQAYGYGVGLTAYLMGTLIDKPGRIFDLALKIPSGIKYALSSESGKNSKKEASYPRELTSLERKGMLFGPMAYLRSHWRYRKVKQQLDPLESLPLSPPTAPASLAEKVSHQ